jgi:hypothetical protein
MLVAVVIGFLLVFLIWNLTGRRKGLPPGPTCYPIIGNVGVIKPSEAVQGHRRLRKAYGDIYSLMIFHKAMIFVHGYDNIRKLFLKHGDLFSDRPNVYPAEVITKKKGILLLCYHLPRILRSMSIFTPLLRRRGSILFYPCECVCLCVCLSLTKL